MSGTSAFQSIKTTPATGRARRRELAEQAEAERQRIEAELLGDLGRPARRIASRLRRFLRQRSEQDDCALTAAAMPKSEN